MILYNHKCSVILIIGSRRANPYFFRNCVKMPEVKILRINNK